MAARKELVLTTGRGPASRSLIGTVALAALLLLPLANAHAEDEEESPVVEEGRQVSIEYTLSLEDGSTADTNVGGEPLVYEQGRRQILPALEKELEGLHVNDSKQVTLPPEKAYGPVNPEAFQEVDSESIPEDARAPGTMLMARDPAGNERPVRVHSVEEDKIVLDLNHPLAGETLTFDVKILGIE